MSEASVVVASSFNRASSWIRRVRRRRMVMWLSAGRDAHHQMRDLAGVPFDAVDELQHHHAVAAHQPLVLAKAMGIATPEPR
jgi:hypothetical protein